jgi:hypothetical protein
MGLTNDGPLPNASALYSLEELLDSIKVWGRRWVAPS